MRRNNWTKLTLGSNLIIFRTVADDDLLIILSFIKAQNESV